MECSKFCNGVGVISCSETKSSEIIENIIGAEELPEAINLTDKIQAYPWHILTKYYSADLNLLSLEEKDLVSQDFADNIEAILIHFNNKEVESFKKVESWLPFVEKFSPQVQLLACDNCSSDEVNPGITRHKVLDWCLKNQFELIELYPNEDSDEEDDFRETRGYKRVVQALHAHTWSNLTLKDPPKYQPSEEVLSSFKQETMRNSIIGDAVIENCATNSTSETDIDQTEDDSTKVKAEKIDALFEEDRWLFDAVGNEDPGGVAFESMFARILNMKEKASSLTGDEKKLYAEKVAIEFWRALGGDEDEIANLSGTDETVDLNGED